MSPTSQVQVLAVIYYLDSLDLRTNILASISPVRKRDSFLTRSEQWGKNQMPYMETTIPIFIEMCEVRTLRVLSLAYFSSIS